MERKYKVSRYFQLLFAYPTIIEMNCRPHPQFVYIYLPLSNRNCVIQKRRKRLCLCPFVVRFMIKSNEKRKQNRISEQLIVHMTKNTKYTFKTEIA